MTNPAQLTALIIAITSLIAAVSTLVGVILTHGKVNAVKKDTTTIIQNGGITNGGTGSSPSSGISGHA